MAISIQNRRAGPTVATTHLRTSARKICAALGLTDVELSILVTDDATMQALNRQWRHHDRPTDVLSFAQHEGEGPGQRILGDVVISSDTAARQARTHRVTLVNELERLLVHGILHLLGHDHVRGGARARRRSTSVAPDR